MNQSDDLRQRHNETATFNKESLNSSLPQSQQTALFPIEEDGVKMSNSVKMPQPLIKNNNQIDKTFEFELRPKQHKQSQQADSGIKDKATLTFYPQIADKLFHQQDSLQKLHEEQNRLKQELLSLKDMICDMVDKKNQMLNEYQNAVKQKKGYRKLLKNLSAEYDGYLFMLDGDYCLKLEEQFKKERKRYVELKKQVHALNIEMSKPIIHNKRKQTNRSEILETALYEMQATYDKQKDLNSKRGEKLQGLLASIKAKQGEIKKISKQLDKYQFEIDEEDIFIDNQNEKTNKAEYEQLETKLNRLKKINVNNDKNKQIEFYRKMKEVKDKEVAIHSIDQSIKEWDQKIRDKKQSVDKEEAKNKSGVSSSTSKQSKLKMPSITLIKRSVSTEKEQSASSLLTFSKNKTPKNVYTLNPQIPKTSKPANNSKRSNYSMQRSMSESDELIDDRPELLMRKRRIYTQLEKNMYFANIENSEQDKLSRVLQFEDKKDIRISSYDTFQKQNNKGKFLLPELQQSEQNKVPYPTFNQKASIIYENKVEEARPQRRLNQQSWDKRNKSIKQWKASTLKSKHRNYQQLCSILDRDRLLIEEDCEYDLSDLVYNSRY